MSKSTVKIKTVRGEPVIELRPLSEPAAWHAALTYADLHEQIDDDVYDSLATWLYENPTDRTKVQKLKKWNPIIKEITHIRHRYLKDLIEDSVWIKQQREEDPKWGSVLDTDYTEESDYKELEKITAKLEKIVKLLQNKE